MKRTFLFLVSAAVLLGIQQGYERFSSSNEPVSTDEMELSSIAEQVIAIPLHTRNGQSIKTARDIHQEGKNLFLISNDILYRFDRKGDFICQITRPEEIHVAGYVVSPATQQVIVLGNTNDIFYYSYGGKLLTKKKLKSDLTHHRMLSVTEYQNKIYSVEENVSASPSTPEPTRQQEVVEYDTTFQRIKSRPLRITQSTSQTLPASFAPHLALANGSFYAYEAPTSPQQLIRDSLRIKQQFIRDEWAIADEENVSLYPLRFSSRYWISTQAHAGDNNYIFCFDSLTNRSWHVKSLTDDFYQTGRVTHIESMDLQGNTYCYCQSGEQIRKQFPNEATQGETVLFIVKLRG